MVQIGNNSDIQVMEQRQEGRIAIEGELHRANAYDFVHQLRTMTPNSTNKVTLDLAGLDIEDGLALTTAVSALKDLKLRSEKVVLTAAPQILGHNLYQLGLLEGYAPIEVTDMRLDESFN